MSLRTEGALQRINAMFSPEDQDLIRAGREEPPHLNLTAIAEHIMTNAAIVLGMFFNMDFIRIC